MKTFDMMIDLTNMIAAIVTCMGIVSVAATSRKTNFWQKMDQSKAEWTFPFLKREKYFIQTAKNTQVNPSHLGMNPSTPQSLGVHTQMCSLTLV